jgi:hypothetical protein
LAEINRPAKFCRPVSLRFAAPPHFPLFSARKQYLYFTVAIPDLIKYIDYRTTGIPVKHVYSKRRVVMFRKMLFLVCCALSLGAGPVFAAYIEGTDTTDVNGYGLGSAFRVTTGTITGQNIVRYHMDGTSTGYFNYSFADIKMAPDSNKSASNVSELSGLYCFAIKKDPNASYSKVQILNQLPDKRYIFKYGSNTTPNDRMLEQTSYNRSIRYKPNNFHNYFQYYCTDIINPICEKNTSSWDPPLPNNNHLLGYIYYKAKIGANIDTSAPINIAQWDSIAFITSTSFEFRGQPTQYFNIVAVYAEGKSDFLLGWSRRVVQAVGTKPSLKAIERLQNHIKIKKNDDGFIFAFQPFPHTKDSPSLLIYTVTGKKVAGFSELKSNKIFWNTTDRILADGPYIVRLEFPDKSVISQMMVYSKK